MDKEIYRNALGEFIGTFILVLLGCGAVAASVLFEAYVGLFQVALVWGIGVTLAIFCSRSLSASHLNPAVSFAMLLDRNLDSKMFFLYVVFQFLGAIVAACVIYLLFHASIEHYEQLNGIIRGSKESIRTAMIFGEFYPNPTGNAQVSAFIAFIAEFIGTFFLVFIVFVLSESSQSKCMDQNQVPVFVGLTVASIICLIAPLTQAGINPARDFGPRLVAFFAGWGGASFSEGIIGSLLVYGLAPLCGGAFAQVIYSRIYKSLVS